MKKPPKIEIAPIAKPEKHAPKTSQVRKISDDKAKQIALGKVPGEVTGIAIEKKLGKDTIVVEVLGKDHSETDVIIDMETGQVLGTEK